MSTIVLRNRNESLNRIESFVEHICVGFNINDTFLGNMIIAVSEVVNIIEAKNLGVKISFKNEQKEFSFVFEDFSNELDLTLFSNDRELLTETRSETDNSLFMINALCDDLIVDSIERVIVLTFINEGVAEKLSRHRKNYLNNYLNQQLKVN
ncbi:MAG: ATP-binding protein [Bacteroidetes bacterium]|nr:ATP-binding protein [Bacteroidota bacterium]